ncbi:DUF4033 domain-containing protein [archaeon]|nr:MAG: DUF4033 domain-containing protein [archaeon]
MHSPLILGKQLGPPFYAPVLTSIVTPLFMSFLIGPSHSNLRKDGQLGGMMIEKCKFLQVYLNVMALSSSLHVLNLTLTHIQESNCKGLCLHQCKLPAQQFFANTLGIPLAVSPNFVTQECQWSWGEIPLNHEDDPDFQKGCLRGCDAKSVAIDQ